jgi:hypothetical protein
VPLIVPEPQGTKRYRVRISSLVSARFMIGIVAVMCGSLCGIAAFFLITFEMVDEVNEKLPEEKRFTRLGGYYFGYRRLMYEYKRLYPHGSCARRVRTLWLLFLACFVIAVLALFRQ